MTERGFHLKQLLERNFNCHWLKEKLWDPWQAGDPAIDVITFDSIPSSSVVGQVIRVVVRVAGVSPSTCPTGTVTLNAGSGMTNYQWYEGGSPITGATGQTYTVTTTGSYTVSYTGSSGCSGTSPAHSVIIHTCTLPGETAPGGTSATALRSQTNSSPASLATVSVARVDSDSRLATTQPAEPAPTTM